METANPIFITTSYFAQVKYIKNPISIAGKVPTWAEKFNVKKFPHLAPTYDLVSRLKNKIITEEQYVAEYYPLRLARWKDGNELIEELTTHFGNRMTLVCWEKPGEFCHRRVVADFIQNTTHIIVPELDFFGEPTDDMI